MHRNFKYCNHIRMVAVVDLINTLLLSSKEKLQILLIHFIYVLLSH